MEFAEATAGPVLTQGRSLDSERAPPTTMPKQFIIYAPSYDPNTGGIIALHRLCDLINRSGRQAFLYPLMPSFELHAHNLRQVPAIVEHFQARFAASRDYKVNPEFITPVLPADLDDQAGPDHVVVYPEIVFGNPLRGPNVVRWMLHRPGHHTRQIYFGSGELHFYYGKAFRQYDYPGCKTSDLTLTIQHSPYKLYLDDDRTRVRSGTAYCLRKGKDRQIQHDLTDSILIDGKPHEEVAEIFKRVKTFISYDLWTAYSRFASLAGCDSVVIPQADMSKEAWAPEASSRMGIAYGFDDVEAARNTRADLVTYYLDSDRAGMEMAQAFLTEVDAFFAPVSASAPGQ